MTIDEALDVICEHRYQDALAAGRPPTSKGAWMRTVRAQIQGEHKAHEIDLMARGLLARAQGKKLTLCREVRGSHSRMHVYDPMGTDPRPDGWNLDVAKGMA